MTTFGAANDDNFIKKYNQFSVPTNLESIANFRGDFSFSLISKGCKSEVVR